MPTSTAPSISSEGWAFSEDDRPQRENARIRLIEKKLAPVGNSLIDAFPELSWKAGSLNEVLLRYKELRDDAERLMKGYQSPGHWLVIDRHKVGASFILAILDVRPLTMPAEEETLEGQRLANAILAFRTAVHIVATFARHDARQKMDPAQLARWQRNVVFPKPRDGREYNLHAYRALHHAYRQKMLNLPMLANWLFIIEQYNNLANP